MKKMDFGNRLVSFHLGIASNEPKNIISEIDRIMYSTEFGPGDHFSIEERYRRDEYGASGVFYDIVLAVGSGIISGVALHIITTYRDLAK